MVTTPNVTEMISNIEIKKNYIEEGKCVNISNILKLFFKINTNPIPHLHP